MVVSLSGGNGSAVALLRCVEMFGAERTHAVFADTNSEDADLYRFLSDVEKAAGITVHRLDNAGMTTRDIFDRDHFIRRGMACKAAIELKAKPLNAFIRANFSPAETRTVSGMDWTEPERMKDLREAWAGQGFETLFPLCVRPRLSACELREELGRRGITPSRLYDLGYPHNNCGGKCVIAGQGQWVGVRRDMPEDFAEWREWEQRFVAKHGFTILARETRENGRRVKHNYSLADLERDDDAGRTFREFRSGCGCFLDAITADSAAPS